MEFSDLILNYKTNKLSKFLKELNELKIGKIINKAFEDKQNINEKSNKFKRN